jgi:putative endonuclease
MRGLVYMMASKRSKGAIQREHNLRHWPRRWKTALVESVNPDWKD